MAAPDARPTARRRRPPTDPVLGAVRSGLSGLPPAGAVLAVSGGGDSMALLHAVALAGMGDRIAAVAVFDHRTGTAGRMAAGAAVETARGLGFRVTAGRAEAPMTDAGEAEWRDARWRFLDAVAAAHGARVVTAHTQDDQLETVAWRAWRGAGPRGLAALDVDGGPLRPLLGVTRAVLADWRRARGIAAADDPANADRRHARARWRHDLLPAMERARPGTRAALLAVAAKAAAWRRDVEAFAAAQVVVTAWPGGWRVSSPALAAATPTDAAWVWAAVLAPLGVILDRRAAVALSAGGRRIPLPRDHELIRASPGIWVLRRPSVPLPEARRLEGEVAMGEWHFRPVDGQARDGGPWHVRLPADVVLEVRAWRPGDRMAGPGGLRRVARWLADAGVPGPLRPGWPVVVSGVNVWWIPGVSHAVLPFGRPSQPYACLHRPR